MAAATHVVVSLQFTECACDDESKLAVMQRIPFATDRSTYLTPWLPPLLRSGCSLLPHQTMPTTYRSIVCEVAPERQLRTAHIRTHALTHTQNSLRGKLFMGFRQQSDAVRTAKCGAATPMSTSSD